MEGLDEIVEEFLVESYESLDQLDSDLVALEETPEDLDRLASIFRTVHTIKGTSGFLALPKLERVAHVGENLLVPLRDGDLKLTEDIASGLLGMVDAIRDMLGSLESSGDEGATDYEPLVDRLQALLSGEPPAPAEAEASSEATVSSEEPAAATAVQVEAAASDAPAEAADVVAVSTTETSTEGGDESAQVEVPTPAAAGPVETAAEAVPEPTATEPEAVTAPEPTADETASEPTATETAAAESPTDATPAVEDPAPVVEAAAPEPVSETVPDPTAAPAPEPVSETAAPQPEAAPQPAAASTPESAASPTAAAPVAAAPSAKPATAKPPAESTQAAAAKSGGEKEVANRSVADATVRIDVQLLDKLMNLVGELVLSRNQILQFGSGSEDPMMVAASQRLNHITTELQEGVMKTRMQPIRNAWSKLPRVVRDLSSTFGKKVEVRMEGADTELDKTILEAIKDPLTHIVRNSVDHGIESPDVRAANGKPPEGTLLLRAFHEGGQVNIEITDDGGGINAERVRNKAIEKGIITAERADQMTERELTSLILLPGFSTAVKVTNVSGRGVGMDVVKTNIERIGGTLDIQSTAGQGTTLRIKIPLTLAIVPALIIKSGGDLYAIPQVSLLELVRLEGHRTESEIEFIQDVPVYRLRENLLPLIFLDEQLGLRPKRGRDEYRENVNIVVLQAEDRHFGLVVDAITDTQEIVVKPLDQHLKNIPAYAGATIMGDGTVALILDVIGIAQRSNVLTEHRDHSFTDAGSADVDRLRSGETFLIVDSENESRGAVRLSTVARLEEFDASKVERCGDSQVIQYRDEIMPLIPLGGYGDVSNSESGRLNTVVYSNGNSSVGVVVGRIVDIVRESVASHEGGSHGDNRRVINGRVTELIDLQQVVRQRLPDYAMES